MSVPPAAIPVIARLAGTPGEIRLLLVALEESPDADAPSAASGWSAAEIVIHMAAVDAEVWEPRLRQLATDPHPTWEWTEPAMERWADPSPFAAVEQFAAGRRALLELAGSLDAEAWTRTGTHAVFGELDGAGLLREALVHDIEHLDALRARLAERHRA